MVCALKSAEGQAEGAREQAIQCARNFLKLGFPVEAIAQGTGLSIEEVEALR